MHTLQSAIGFGNNPRKLLMSSQNEQEKFNHPENRLIHNLIQSNQKKAKQNQGSNDSMSQSTKPTKKGQIMKNLFSNKQQIKIQPKNYVPI